MARTSDDQQKLNALRRFFVLDHAPTENELERIVRFTGQLFGVAYAFLTLRQDEGDEKVTAAYGFELKELPEDAILFRRPEGPSIPVAVADASVDARFDNNPLIHAEKAARLYAGVPLKSAQGFTLGTLAVMDTSVQKLNSAGMAMLADIGALVEPVLQLVQARQEREAAASSLSRGHAIPNAALAVRDSLARGASAFSDALAQIGPAAMASSAAFFLHDAAGSGGMKATCVAFWRGGDGEPVASTGGVLDLASKDLVPWLEAFANHLPVSGVAPKGPRAGEHPLYVAAIPLAAGDVRPGFVLLDRSTPWSDAELTVLQLGFSPLCLSLVKTQHKSADEIFDTAPIPMAIAHGSEGLLARANEAAMLMLGLTKGEMPTSKIVDGVSSADRAKLTAFLEHAAVSKPEPIEVRLQHVGTKERLFRITASPVIEGDQAAYQLVFVDITADRQRETALASELEQANEATKTKSDFLASMSHEIRTALTSILGYAEFLADELEADQLDMAQTILGSSERLLQTLNSVMDMERLESAGDALNLQPVSISNLVIEAASVFERQAKSRGLAFVCEGADQHIHAWADECALMRVIDNMVSNALKFTDKGGIRLRLSATDGWMCLEVQDTGRGIDEAFLPYLFDRFKRENSESSRAAASSGLGMTLTKRLVELMGGQISVSSQKGKGSVFRVVLRAAPPPASVNTGGDGIAAMETPAAG